MKITWMTYHFHRDSTVIWQTLYYPIRPRESICEASQLMQMEYIQI